MKQEFQVKSGGVIKKQKVAQQFQVRNTPLRNSHLPCVDVKPGKDGGMLFPLVKSLDCRWAKTQQQVAIIFGGTNYPDDGE